MDGAKKSRKMRGQIVLILLLLMAAGLGIGLSVVQRSLTDVSTATKIEQSARAFSAAEAGIERALGTGSIAPLNFPDTQAQATVSDSGPIPGSREILEYPSLRKENIAHVWLANPNDTPVATYYDRDDIDIYWGTPPGSSGQKAAIEITYISKQGSNYSTRKFFFDPDNARVAQNGFEDVSASCNQTGLSPINTTIGSNRSFYCRKTLTGLKSGTATPILMRIKLFYHSSPQPVAIKPLGDCPQLACSLPRQGRLFTSVGTSGQTQRQIKVLKEYQVVLPYFDYAIFSAGELEK